MKYTINIQWLLLLFVMTMSSNSFAQGIRKDYTEMTDDERDALISAYWNLGGDENQNGPVSGLVGEIGDFHAANFGTIHFAGTSATDVFLAWHRQTSVELQRAMKNELNNEWITIPYWDWTISNSHTDNLWSSDWLGDFDTAWSLDRVFDYNWNNPHLPNQSNINGALEANENDGSIDIAEFFQFSRFELESNLIHAGGHVWIGGLDDPTTPQDERGTMSRPDSPKDPTFFFHHNMVDKIWADWYEIYGGCQGGCYTKTDMPRYDGTHINALQESLPSVDPDDLVDPRSLGIFYSDRVNGLTTLDKYTVNNANTSSEKFGYQFKIEAKDDFIVPDGKDAEFRSCEVIHLLPGFEANHGSFFLAHIGGDCTVSSGGVVGEKLDSATDDSVTFKNYPNPFTGHTTIEFTLSKDTPVTLLVSDAIGRQVEVLLDNEVKAEGTHLSAFDGSNYPAGIYYYTIQAGEYVGTQKMTLVK